MRRLTALSARVVFPAVHRHPGIGRSVTGGVAPVVIARPATVGASWTSATRHGLCGVCPHAGERGWPSAG